MNFIGYLNPDEWKSEGQTMMCAISPYHVTRSTHVNDQSNSCCLNIHIPPAKAAQLSQFDPIRNCHFVWPVAQSWQLGVRNLESEWRRLVTSSFPAFNVEISLRTLLTVYSWPRTSRRQLTPSQIDDPSSGVLDWRENWWHTVISMLWLLCRWWFGWGR